MTQRAIRTVGLSLLALGLCVVAIPAAESPVQPDPVFPDFPSIRGNVEFWTDVFSEWSLGQIVVHDLEHLSVVYEVVDLPGPVEERYTDEQKEFAERRVELWSDRLRRLERKVVDGDALTEDEKAWALLVATGAGTDRLPNAHERVRTQRGLRERFRRGLEISGRYEPRLREIFRDAGLPEDLAYLPHVESSFQAAARSSAGAVGVWQFTRGTGRMYLRINRAVDERLDPIAAARGAAAYFRDAYRELGNWPLALTSYNHGLMGMMRAAEKHGTDYERVFLEYDGRSFGFASRNFYSEFLAARTIASAPERFFPEGLTPEPELDAEEVVLDRRATPKMLSSAYGVPVSELVARNPAWTARAARSGLPLPAGHAIWLPPGTLARLGGNPELGAGHAGFLDEEGLYVVSAGDSLSGIAQTFDLTLNELRSFNGIKRGSALIHPGQRLRLAPAPAETIHVVRTGDSLSTVARRYGMKLDELRRLNGIQRGASLIHVGQRLRVHGDDTPAIYVVRRGDTALGIALRHGVRLSALLSHNKLRPNSTIYPGQKIRIPRGG